MPVELIIPKLGLTMKEAKIAKWVKAEGDRVEAGEVVLIIETEKITFEVESSGAGYLNILQPKDATLPVGAKVGIIFEDQASYQSQAGATPAEAVAVEAAPAAPAPSPPAVVSASSSTVSGGRVKSSPLARRIAKEHGVDLQFVSGSGPGGRITRDDVLRYLEEGVPPREVIPEVPAEEPMEPFVAETIPIEGMRKQIFRHMHQSLQETAQITLTSEVDATELIRLRQSLLKRYEPEGQRITFNAILVRILGKALSEHAFMNAAVQDDQIVQWSGIHVGVAMELGDGLIVPVVRNADKLAIIDIHRILEDLFVRARERKLLLDEIQGGTFTLTNLGHLDVDAFTPILNRPESGIMGAGRIIEKPVVSRDGGEARVEIRSRMILSLTVDHRIIDGAPAARFLGRVRELIEDPYLMLS